MHITARSDNVEQKRRPQGNSKGVARCLTTDWLMELCIELYILYFVAAKQSGVLDSKGVTTRKSVDV